MIPPPSVGLPAPPRRSCRRIVTMPPMSRPRTPIPNDRGRMQPPRRRVYCTFGRTASAPSHCQIGRRQTNDERKRQHGAATTMRRTDKAGRKRRWPVHSKHELCVRHLSALTHRPARRGRFARGGRARRRARDRRRLRPVLLLAGACRAHRACRGDCTPRAGAALMPAARPPAKSRRSGSGRPDAGDPFPARTLHGRSAR